MENWGKRLRELREKKELSQHELAIKMGKDMTSISRYERGVGAKNMTRGVKKLLSSIFSSDEIYYIEKGEYPKEEVSSTANGVMTVPVLSIKASAGGGNNVESVDEFVSGEVLGVDELLFPGGVDGIKAVRVDGMSMVPVLLPDSWVFFRESELWSGDGLYVLIFRGVLMVKLVEADPQSGNLWVKSANPQYQSWEYDPTQDQSSMKIVGRVVRAMV